MPTSDDPRGSQSSILQQRGALSFGAGFWACAVAFAALMSFATVPTPLYALYQERDGFATVVVTVIFAAYAFGVMLALYLAGHTSDQSGRRRVMLLSTAFLIVSAVMFLLWDSAVGLIVARFVSGLGIGALTPTATAWIVDLRAGRRPSRPGLATTVGGMANLGGLALGPLVGGLFAEWAKNPLRSPYAVYLVVIAAAAVLIALTPETVRRPERRAPWRPQSVAAPSGQRKTYWAACFGIFGAFSITGFYGSIAPTILHGVLGESDHLVAGLTAFAVFAASALSQAVFARLTIVAQITIGTASMLAGLVGIALGALLASLAVFLLGGVIAGAGAGLLIRSSLATAGSLAAPDRRAAVLTGMFLYGYAGMCVPPLALGVLLVWLPIVPTTVGFSAVVLVIALWAGITTRRHHSS